jgi:hypothetical protein
MNCLKPKIIAVFIILAACLGVSGYSLQYAERDSLVPLRWKSGTIKVSVSSSLLRAANIKSDKELMEVVRRSYSRWSDVSALEFIVTVSDKQSVSPAGRSGDGVSLLTIAATSENLLLFQGEAAEVPARARIFYNRKGYITEADIALNPFTLFSTDSTPNTYDLEAVVTHEIGHQIGLGHSGIIGSTMQTNYVKNGIYGLPATALRTLSADDVAGIRALYGPNSEAGNCCGGIEGALKLPTGKPLKNWQVWLAETESGRIAAGSETATDGVFTFSGLPTGKYEVFIKPTGLDSTAARFSAEKVATVDVKRNESVELAKIVKPRLSDFALDLAGFNAQLTDLAIPVNPGRQYTIYFSGSRLNSSNLKFDLGTPFIQVMPETFREEDFGKDIEVYSIQLMVRSSAPAGEYGLRVFDAAGGSSYLIGALTIDEVENPWVTIPLPFEE